MHIMEAYPECESIIGKFFQSFQSVVDIAGSVNCFHSVVRVHDLTQLHCGGVDGIICDVDGLNRRCLHCTCGGVDGIICDVDGLNL